MDKITPYYKQGGITIYCGECAGVMTGLDAGSIDLTVTSPPYDNLRDYNGYIFDFEPIAAELWRVTKPGGVVVWVVGDATINGSETGTSFRQALGFMNIGFNCETMIYEANGTGAKGSNYYYWQSFEFMFVFAKCNPKTSNRLTFPRRLNGGGERLSKKGGKKTIRNRPIKAESIRSNVWKYTGDRLDIHPAPFPEALARDHIISWSNPGDIVLDPMCGSGTTLKMAQQLGRRTIGIEISEEYCKIAVERLRQPSFFSIPDNKQTATQPPEQLAIDV